MGMTPTIRTAHLTSKDVLLANWLQSIGIVPEASLEDADLVVFPGGADINPTWYGEHPLQTTQFIESLDELEFFKWRKLESTRPKLGICRGAQFLNVLNGGRLWQDVNNHNKGDHVLLNKRNEAVLPVTSAHHQMMIPHESGEVIAVAYEATYKLGWETFLEEKREKDWETEDTEVIWYPETNTLCFQPHPEYEHLPSSHYCHDLMVQLFLDNK